MIRRTFLKFVTFFGIVVAVSPARAILPKERDSSMPNDQLKPPGVYQLRIYEVSSAKKEIFHHRFKNHALRIMKRYGFEVIALWESSSVVNFEFIYILKWPDAATMDRQWKLFLADTEWIEIKKKTVEETGEPVIKATGRLLSEVDYSPVFNPA